MRYKIRFILPMLGILLLLSGCSDESVDNLLKKIVKAPPSSIERDVKGHEQIYSVQLILRLARKSDYKLTNGDHTYVAYANSEKATPIPLVQEITLSKDDNGKMVITSDRKVFDVVKSEKFHYGLELKYYDVNGMLINYQFSSYYPDDEDNSTLLVHQHFFTIQNYSLDGRQLIYPMSLDSIYYNNYTFSENGDGKRVPASKISASNIYALNDDNRTDKVRYRSDLAEKSVENSMKPAAMKPYKDPATGKTFNLYQAVNNFSLNEKVPEIFSYEYRDTDPVEEELGKELTDYDDMNRLRSGSEVIRLRENRSLDDGARYDALGFKGILRFKKTDMAFQMRICICHILNRVSIPANDNRLGKYGNTADGNYNGGVYNYNALQAVWNSFDIDYPVAFRVIADLDGDHEQCKADIRRFYPKADDTAMQEMFWGDGNFFNRIPWIRM